MTSQPDTAAAETFREAVRTRYAAAARAVTDIGASCGPTPAGTTTPTSRSAKPQREVFGPALYEDADRGSLPNAAVAASLARRQGR